MTHATNNTQNGTGRRSLDELPDFDWRTDAIANYALAYRLKALGIGSARPKTLPELYFCESAGVIP
jgi:hypothetical protein